MDLALDSTQLPSPSTSDTNNASPNKDLDLKQMKVDDLRQWLSQQGDLSNPADSKISYANMHAKRSSLCSPLARTILRKPVTNKARKDNLGGEAKKDSLSLVGGDTKASNQTSGTGSSDRPSGGLRTTNPFTDSSKKSQLPRAQEKIKASETQYPSYTTSSHYLQASSAASMHSFSHTSTISGQAIPPGHSVASTTIPIMNSTSAQGPANNSVPNSLNPSSGKSTSESTIIRKEGGARLKRKAPVIVKHQSSSWSRRRWMCLMFFMIVLFAALSSGATLWYLQQLEKRRQTKLVVIFKLLHLNAQLNYETDVRGFYQALPIPD